MAKPAVQNRASAPRRPGPWASLARALELMVGRIEALEPLASRIAALEGREMPPPAIGIAGAVIRDDGHLELVLSDGKRVDAGLARAPAAAPLPAVKGDPGLNGIGIAEATIDQDGHLLLMFSNGRVSNAGRVTGLPGENADPAELNRLADALAASNREIGTLREQLVVLQSSHREQAAESSRLLADVAARHSAALAEIKASIPLPAPELPDLPVALAIDADGSLMATYGSGRQERLGRVTALPAAPAAQIRDVRVDDEGHLQVFLTDERRFDAGRVRGRDADPPPPPVPGRSITKAEITEAGDLLLRFSDGSEATAGRVRPEPGPEGRGIAAIEIRDKRLVVSLTDKSEIDLGRVVGEDGKPVEGSPGRGIAAIEIRDKRLVVSLTDKSEIDLGRVVGRDGTNPKPVPGPPGGLDVLEISEAFEDGPLAGLAEATVRGRDGAPLVLLTRI